MPIFRLVRFVIRTFERTGRRDLIARTIQHDVQITPRSPWAAPTNATEVLRGPAWVVDGDTIIIERVSIRLAGIDAPELNHPYGRNARSAMIALCRGQIITARLLGEMSYERSVAVCTLPDGRDLAAELVKAGLAIDWPKFSGGRYRHLEPVGARRKLWRCDARQKGRSVGSGV